MGNFAQSLATIVMGALESNCHREHAMYKRMEPWKSEPEVGEDYGYLLRVSSSEGRNSGFVSPNAKLSDPTSSDFQFPEEGYVLADVRGAFWGIYGLLDGLGDWNHLPRYKDATWQIMVVRRDECMPDPMGGSVRVPRGWMKYSGDAVGALQIMIPYMRDRGILDRIFKDRIHPWAQQLLPEVTREIAQARPDVFG